jgi:hypothetical protein
VQLICVSLKFVNWKERRGLAGSLPLFIPFAVNREQKVVQIHVYNPQAESFVNANSSTKQCADGRVKLREENEMSCLRRQDEPAATVSRQESREDRVEPEEPDGWEPERQES